MNNTVSRALGFISRHRRAASGAALVLAVLLGARRRLDRSGEEGVL